MQENTAQDNKPNIRPVSDPAQAKPMTDEADIGSGEKTPAQLETEEMIRDIPPLAPAPDQGRKDGGPMPKPGPV